MDELQFTMESASYKEKIALAALEEAKAHERVKELEYEFARFGIEWLHMAARQAAAQQQAMQQQAAGVTPPPQPPR